MQPPAQDKSTPTTSVKVSDLDPIIEQERIRQEALPQPKEQGKGWEPCRVNGTLEEAVERINNIDFPDEKIQSEEDKEKIRRQQMLGKFLKKVGYRYEEATFDSFERINKQQQCAVNSLVGYIDDYPEMENYGRGLILYGPRGTGKDHLLVATARQIIQRYGKNILWVNGMCFFGDVRDLFSDHPGYCENDLVRPLTYADVLYLSDPAPLVGTITDTQARALFRVIDSRYRDYRNKTTWISINVADPDEMNNRIGPQLADRLRHNAVCIRCNWPTYRKALKNI